MLKHVRDIIVEIFERRIIYKIPIPNGFPAERKIIPESIVIVRNTTNIEIHFKLESEEVLEKDLV